MVCPILVKEIDALQNQTTDSDLLNALNKLQTRYRGIGGCTAVTQESFTEFLSSMFSQRTDLQKFLKLLNFINTNKNIAPEMFKYFNPPEDQDGGKSRSKSRRHRRKSRRHRRKSRRHRRKN
jgi:hypothetical protein